MSGKTYLEAVREALIEEMESDDRVFIMGEDIAVYGGAFKVTEGMLEQFGEERVIDTPIAEAGMIGAAVGAALMDRRPIVEIQFWIFFLVVSMRSLTLQQNATIDGAHLCHSLFVVPVAVALVVDLSTVKAWKCIS